MCTMRNVYSTPCVHTHSITSTALMCFLCHCPGALCHGGRLLTMPATRLACCKVGAIGWCATRCVQQPQITCVYRHHAGCWACDMCQTGHALGGLWVSPVGMINHLDITQVFNDVHVTPWCAALPSHRMPWSVCPLPASRDNTHSPQSTLG